MTRLHFSAKPIERLHAVKPWTEEGGYLKPHGFWYECDGDWQRWTSGESFDDLSKKLCYRLELRDANVLKITTLAEFDAFQKQYVTVAAYPGSSTKMPDVKRLYDDGYDGLEIAPYQWKRRLGMGTMWYYGWDCASGVLWTPRNATVTLEPNPVEAKA